MKHTPQNQCEDRSPQTRFHQNGIEGQGNRATRGKRKGERKSTDGGRAPAYEEPASEVPVDRCVERYPNGKEPYGDPARNTEEIRLIAAE